MRAFLVSATLLFGLALPASAADTASQPGQPWAPDGRQGPSAPAQPDALTIAPGEFTLAFAEWNVRSTREIVVPRGFTNNRRPEAVVQDKQGNRSPVPAPVEVPADPVLVTYARDRAMSQVNSEILPYFDLFLYVSKATEGPYAQRMYVYQRDREMGGMIRPVAQWLVSTGREQHEPKDFTTTPNGLFKLDPDRFTAFRRSIQWDGAPMPYTMFYDAQIERRPTGYAIHGVGFEADLQYLGQRASAGCIRLHPQHARELYYNIRENMTGRVPVFAYDRKEDRTNVAGQPVRLADGSLRLKLGYRVLMIVEDFSGGPETPLPTEAVVASIQPMMAAID